MNSISESLSPKIHPPNQSHGLPDVTHPVKKIFSKCSSQKVEATRLLCKDRVFVVPQIKAKIPLIESLLCSKETFFSLCVVKKEEVFAPRFSAKDYAHVCDFLNDKLDVAALRDDEVVDLYFLADYLRLNSLAEALEPDLIQIFSRKTYVELEGLFASLHIREIVRQALIEKVMASMKGDTGIFTPKNADEEIGQKLLKKIEFIRCRLFLRPFEEIIAAFKKKGYFWLEGSFKERMAVWKTERTLSFVIRQLYEDKWFLVQNLLEKDFLECFGKKRLPLFLADVRDLIKLYRPAHPPMTLDETRDHVVKAACQLLELELCTYAAEIGKLLPPFHWIQIVDFLLKAKIPKYEMAERFVKKFPDSSVYEEFSYQDFGLSRIAKFRLRQDC